VMVNFKGAELVKEVAWTQPQPHTNAKNQDKSDKAPAGRL
jgi:hypothetical protein